MCKLVFVVLTASLLVSCGGDSTYAPEESEKPLVYQNMPAPDCATQNCNGLRIIDGNAEAYRLDAIRRAQDPQYP